MYSVLNGHGDCVETQGQHEEAVKSACKVAAATESPAYVYKGVRDGSRLLSRKEIITPEIAQECLINA